MTKRYIAVHVPQITGQEYVKVDYDLYESLYNAFLFIFYFNIKANGNLVFSYRPDSNNKQLPKALKQCNGIEDMDFFVDEKGYYNEEITYKFLIEYEAETTRVTAIYDNYLSAFGGEEHRRIDMTNLFLRSNVDRKKVNVNKFFHSVVKGVILEATSKIDYLQTAVGQLVRFVNLQPSYKISRFDLEDKEAKHAVASEQALRVFKHTFFSGLDNQIGQFLQSPELERAQNIARSNNKQDPTNIPEPVSFCSN